MAESCPVMAHQCQSYGIFWDIENCPIPQRADTVVKNLKQFISSKYESIVGQKPEPCAFFCACNAIKLEQMHVEVLNRMGVDILHVNPTRPNQNFKVVADDKLKECIQKFIEHHSNKEKSLIFVITGDVDFAPQIRTARRAGFKVILLYPSESAQTSIQLMEAVDEAHSYHAVVNGLTNPMDIDLNVPSSSQRHGVHNNANSEASFRDSQLNPVSGVPKFIEQVMSNVAEFNNDKTKNKSGDDFGRAAKASTKQHNVRIVDEEKLRQLQELTTLDRHQALQMLENTNWNVEMAVNVLFN